MVATASVTKYQLFIGGAWQDAATGKTFEVINPATLEPIATVPDAGRADRQQAIDLACNAQPAWAEITAAERSRIMRRAFDLLMERQDELGRLITLEEGKPLAEGKTELAYAASFIEWYAEEAKRVYGET